MMGVEKMGKVILFQGDSITDAGRLLDIPEFLGKGYVRKIADYFKETGEDHKIINRGISGNRTRDLAARWQKDCIDLAPDILTILVGVNDVWRKYDKNDPTSIEDFEKSYEEILSRGKNETSATIILMEPFVLPTPEDRKAWRTDLDAEIQVVRTLAKKYGCHLIPLDAEFAVASVSNEYAALAADGVHPTDLGHQFICDLWLQIFNFIMSDMIQIG
jgi:lysophospholipase L1-like esterase